MLSCVWNLRVFPEMHDGDSAPSCCAFTHWVAFEEVSGPRVLFKSGQGNRGLSACGTTHGASLKFPSEAGYILRYAGKAGEPSRQRRGIDSPVAIRRGEGAQMKWGQNPRCYPRGNPACRGTFGGRMKAVRDRFTLQGGTGDFPSYAVAGEGVILRRRGNHVFFLDLRWDSRVTTGITGFLMCRPWVAQSSILVASESLGLRSSHCRAKETSSRPVSGT